MSATPPLAVACILTRYYSLSLEATLQATGFDDDDVNFISPVDPTSDVVLSALPADVRAWAAQHVSVWRRCAEGEAPVLIFQDDVTFASDNVLEATRALVAAVDARTHSLVFLGAAMPDDDPTPRATSGIHSLMPVQSASPSAAYVLWPTAARTLLASLPIDASVSAFLGKFIKERKLGAFMALPALTVAEEPAALQEAVDSPPKSGGTSPGNPQRYTIRETLKG